jgi:hypothetical protein
MSDQNRDAYIDLLARTILNTIYEDPSIFPAHGMRFERDNRDYGRDWPQYAHSMIGAKRMANLRIAVETVLAEGISGDFIETGVWRGGSCIFMRGVLKAYGVTDRIVHVADSFAGLPPPDAEKYPEDANDTLFSYPQLAVSRRQVEENFSRYGLLDDQVRFIEGYFEETLPGIALGPLAIARLDGDMYSSTIVSLEALYPKLSPGGFLIVDDYALGNCRAAVDDFRRANAIAAPLVAVDWTGCYWRKPG